MTNAHIIDHWGIVKADIGLKAGVLRPQAKQMITTCNPTLTSSLAPA